MTKKIICTGMLVCLLVFGMMVVGCDTNDNGTDPALNGTWVRGNVEMTYNNGNFQSTYNGTPFFKGTYSTSDGEITSTSTHIYGSQIKLESNWYSKDELAAVPGAIVENDEVRIGNNSVTFSTTTRNYSINGNELTLGSGTNAITYTRK